MSALYTELRRLASLAAPVVVGQLAAMSMGVVDMLMVGRLDARDLAAVAVGTTWYFGFLVLAFGTLYALDPVFSQAWGAQDTAAEGRGLRRGLALVVVLAPAVMAGQWLAPWGLRLLGQPEEVVPIAVTYTRLASFAVPSGLVFVVLRMLLQAEGRMRQATAAIVLANLANAALDYAFVFGEWGAPRLGAAGAAIATAGSHLVQLGLLVLFARGRLAEVWAAGAGAVDLARVGQLLRTGLPVGFQIATEAWAFQVASYLAGIVGTDSLAAHGVVLNMASLSFMVPLGVSTAASIRVGNLLGAGERWTTAARAALVLGIGVMSVSALAFALLPEALARVYTDDPAVIALAVGILPVAAAFQLFDGTQVVAYGILRGAGDFRLGAYVNLAAFWAFGLPLGAWLAFGRGLGLFGLWVGLAVGLAGVALILTFRLRWTARQGGFRVKLDPT